METFKKLKSGNWNLRKYDYTDERGQKHYKSFTAPTKAEIRRAVVKWKENRQNELRSADSVSDAFDGYFKLKKNVLSPATLRGYETIKKNYIDAHQIGRIKLNKLDNKIIQRWVSDLAAEHKPKTVRNAFGLLSAVLTSYAPELKLRVTLPQKIKPALYCPNSNDIEQILTVVRSKNDNKMLLCIMLAAFVPARRSEIAALTRSDIDGDQITINKALVHDPDGNWVLKGTKTTSSTRTVQINQFILDLIPDGEPSDRIIGWTPDYITNRFADYVKQAGVPYFRFHDLRHYGASMLLTIMSARYVQDRGGWSSSYVMNSHYNNVIDLEKTRQTKEALKMFNTINL